MTTMIYLLLTFKEYSFDSGQQRINVTLKNVTESIKIQQFILHGDHDIKIYNYMTIIFKKMVNLCIANMNDEELIDYRQK